MGKFTNHFAITHKVEKLLVVQAEYLTKSAAILSQMVSADPDDFQKLYTDLHREENQADEASHDVLKELVRTFVLPFDRDDLVVLTSLIDDCVDAIDEAGDDLVLYQVKQLPQEIVTVCQIISECAVYVTEALKAIIKKPDPSIREYWAKINDLENKADRIYRNFIADLVKPGRDPLDVFRYKILYDAFEEAVDSFEDLAAHLETIAIKES